MKVLALIIVPIAVLALFAVGKKQSFAQNIATKEIMVTNILCGKYECSVDDTNGKSWRLDSGRLKDKMQELFQKLENAQKNGQPVSVEYIIDEGGMESIINVKVLSKNTNKSSVSSYVNDESIEKRNVLKNNVTLTGVVKYYPGTPDSGDIPHYILQVSKKESYIICFCGSSNFKLGCAASSGFENSVNKRLSIIGDYMEIENDEGSYKCINLMPNQEETDGSRLRQQKEGAPLNDKSGLDEATNSAPPPSVVEEGGHKAFWYLAANGGFDNFSIINTNHYEKVFDGEHIYFYEYIYKDKKTGESNGLSSTVAIVKRGNSWYFFK